jgi:hypothetical protein
MSAGGNVRAILFTPAIGPRQCSGWRRDVARRSKGDAGRGNDSSRQRRKGRIELSRDIPGKASCAPSPSP